MNIDDPTNRWLIHPIGRALLPLLMRWNVEPNSVSLAGFGCGFCAAMAYTAWQQPFWATAGFVMMLCWHVCDGLDGMLARATAKFSDAGRLLDGICDYAAFVLVYLVIGANLPAGTHWPAYLAMVAAGLCHVWQSALYEAERERFHRRLEGRPPQDWGVTAYGAGVEGGYVRLRLLLEPGARRFDRAIATAPSSDLLGCYARTAAPLLRLSTILGANGRTLAIWIACLAGRPILFWLWEILVLSPIAVLLFWRLRQVERRIGATVQP
jgi:CDP-diacylglycerol---serine O-phosphatidyltransferase